MDALRAPELRDILVTDSFEKHTIQPISVDQPAQEQQLVGSKIEQVIHIVAIEATDLGVRQLDTGGEARLARITDEIGKLNVVRIIDLNNALFRFVGIG